MIDLTSKEISEYYSSDEITDKYIEDSEKGLTDKEERVVDRYFRGEAGTVLDLGCGTGRTTAALVEDDYDVVGVDLVESYVHQAKSLLTVPEFAVGDATALPFSDERFDAVLFSYNGIDHIAPEEERYRTLLEIRRTLKPDGVFAFSTHNLWFSLISNPASAASIRETVAFWSLNLRPKWLLSRYKMDNRIAGGPIPVYYISPRKQKRQLRACGFDVLDVVRERHPLRRRFDPFPYYVAQKSE